MDQVNHMPPKPTFWDKNSVENIASVIAEKLNFSIGDPIEPVVSKLGGRINYGWNSFDEKDGGSIVARSIRDFTIHVSELTSSTRDRFTIAHELGHLFLHLRMVQKDDPEAVMRATRHVDPKDSDLQRAEWEANWFAAQFLMPRTEFKHAVSTHGLPYAASVFNVSKQAADVRFSSI